MGYQPVRGAPGRTSPPLPSPLTSRRPLVCEDTRTDLFSTAGTAAMTEIITAAVGLIVGAAAASAFLIMGSKSVLKKAHADADQLREQARREAETQAKEIELAAKQEQIKLRESFEKEMDRERKGLTDQENRLAK